MMPQSQILTSWKEIADYLHRGVRTVQRWEITCNLPVRRPSGHLRGSVLALKKDLDDWAAGCRMRAPQTSTAQVYASAAVSQVGD